MKIKILLLILCTVSLSYGITIIDDFDDGIVDSTFWSIQSSNNTILEEFDSEYRARVNPGGCGGPNVCFLGKRTKQTIVGDFVAYIKFRIVDTGDGDITPLMLMATNDCINQRVAAEWYINRSFSGYRMEYIDTTAADTVWTMVGGVTSTTDREGGLRLRRSGNWFYAAHIAPFLGWWESDSVEIDMGNTYLTMYIQNQGSHETIDVAIDSFYLECDSLWFSECNPPVFTPFCLNDYAQVQITDEQGVWAPSVDITIDGIAFRYDYPEVSWDGEWMEITPGGGYPHGTIHEICFNYAEDIVGNAMIDTSCYSFITDLMPPIVSEFTPAPGETLFNLTPVLSARVEDEYNDINLGSSYISIRGMRFFFNSGLVTWRNDSIIFNSADLGYSFPLGDSVELCIFATDEITFCDVNDTLVCWSFISGDSAKPEIQSYFPYDSLVSSCDDQYVDIIITDNVAIDTNSIVLNINGSEYIYPNSMSYLNDTLRFIPDIPWNNGMNTICVDSVADIWKNLPIDLPYCFDMTIDLGGPVFDNIQPVEGTVLSTVAPIVSADITDIMSSVGYDSFYVSFMDSVVYNLDSSDTALFDFDGSMFTFHSDIAGVHISGGTEFALCIGAYDTPDLCDPNLGDTCWVISIADGGPVASQIYPLDWQYSSCEYQEIHILLSDTDGINHSSVRLSVNGRIYDYASPEISYLGDTLVFTPTIAYDDSSVVQVQLIEIQDMLDNPLSVPFTLDFIADFSPPSAEIIYPLAEDVVRNLQPDIQIAVDDLATPILAESTLFIVNDTLSIQYPSGDGISWDHGSDLSGEFIFHMINTSMRLVTGDSVTVVMRVCDNPDYCEPNCATYSWVFRTESNRACERWPNPFTPNDDDYNDYVRFEYPGQDLDNAKLTIFDTRGTIVFERDVPASTTPDILERTWDGLSEGSNVPQGCYLYIITVDGKEVCNGTISLVR